MKATAYLKALSISIIFVLALPAIHNFYPLWKVNPLNGAYEKQAAATFTLEAWLEGDYQQQTDLHLKQHFGGYDNTVRWYNQYLFSVMKMPTNNSVVIGKEGQLYQNVYVEEVTGQSYIGQDSMRYLLEKAKQLQDKVIANGKQIIFMLAPNKARIYAEFLPEGTIIEPENTNYHAFLRESQRLGLKVLDVEGWFLEKKKTAPYPLFSPYGIHWSIYSVAEVMDSVLNYIAVETGRPTADVVFDSVWTSEQLKDPDNDLEYFLNVARPLPPRAMPYYTAHFTTENVFKPRLLAIGDSFLGTYFFQNYLSRDCFTEAELWYYYKTVFPADRPLTNQDKGSVKDKDVIIIEITTGNLADFAWGALPSLDYWYESNVADQLEAMKAKIYENKDWYAAMEKKAQEQGRSVEEMITMDAQYMLEQGM